jgi:hypothetical protein
LAEPRLEDVIDVDADTANILLVDLDLVKMCCGMHEALR